LSFTDSLKLHGTYPEYSSLPAAVPRPLQSSPVSILCDPPTISFDIPHPHKNSKSHKKLHVPKVKLNSYCAYPALRQAMEVRKVTHRSHVESIRTNYYDKCESDVEDITKILSLLHHTLNTRKFKIAAMNNATTTLTCQTWALDKQLQKLKETEYNTIRNHENSVNLYAKALAGQGQSQVDKFSRIFTLATDIVSQEEDSLNPFFAFKLHRCFTPHLLGLAWAVTQPHSSISAFTPDSESIARYSQVVQGLQLKLYDHEWMELKDDINEYEYADLPWSQSILVLCGDPSLEQDDGW
jgi:hypothetical protein